MKYIELEDIIDELELDIAYRADNIEDIKIRGREVNRPGLQLAGYFTKFAFERLQVMGNVEWHYCKGLDKDTRYERLENIFEYDIPALIVSRGLPVLDEIMELAKKYNRTILTTENSTTKFISKLLNYLDYKLSPETTVHGVLIEVYGVGTLIMGKSGVGKSETALELIKRGHRLIADDAVELKRIDNKLRGEAPNLIRHFMEIRGIGILDIERLYGVGAVKKSEYLDLIVEMEYWDESKAYDRVGLDEEYINLLGVEVPRLVIPVQPGRNLAMIVEVAARNTRQKNLGYNAAQALDNRIKEEIKERKEKRK